MNSQNALFPFFRQIIKCAHKYTDNCHLWSRVPQSNYRVNTTGSQEAVAGVWLQAVDYGLIPLQDPHQICCLFLPDKEGAIIWATDNVLAFAVKEKNTIQLYLWPYLRFIWKHWN